MNKKDSRCHQLDDFLDGFLPRAEQARFAEHLSQCSHCRQIVDQQRVWDESVREYAAGIKPPVGSRCPTPDTPAALIDRRRAMGVVVMVAALLLVAISLHFVTRDSDRPIPVPVHKNVPLVADDRLGDKAELPPENQPMRSLASSSHLAVVQPQQTDGVTFVMLYPKLQVNPENNDAN